MSTGDAPGREHPDFQTLLDFASGRLSDAAVELLGQHLGLCARCLERSAAVARKGAAVKASQLEMVLAGLSATRSS